ncbi:MULTISPECIES: prepilin-type cleavage/methylation domain-containing protein [Legionella]|uniref:Prepilin-type cleavage/methylation domain-containing protein n=1 Tax=Legionella septentrionalis TaxID=2498109 RepID=A0A3S0X3H1_9GAMM|nr:MULTISPECIES: prepilin-type cleavage/methylation domain-containing protein [Legionella]MCP0913658.1 hypothetical protein [Legionella sp. 27cVA30]RUQ84440.1 prepilin-type cleavage/methylation domain-containing protein [Legionella septentrionalis]RUQ94658.1 prepilin-type cleavage/methylation domain-containing protein [Legionella septentrionalis]RUR09243.1 prepilin-type cleavage/methylation domain-containing protein [Legionella septentrionalis]RUR14489.1 prepilin-type cleavage/methylation doma
MKIYSKDSQTVFIPQSGLGFTLFEILLVFALVATLALIVTPIYQQSSYRTKIDRTIADIKEIETAIENYYVDNGYKYPASLTEINMNNKLDPWGHPYQYLNIASLPDKGNNPKTRKDKNLYPLNSDYDLYSMGEDGKTDLSLTSEVSEDDVIRANNGSYVGLGENY